MVERVVNSYEDMPKLGDPVASKGKRSTDSVGSGSDNVQHDSKSDRMIHQISGIGLGGDEVPGGIGTFPINNKCLIDLFLVQIHSV